MMKFNKVIMLALMLTAFSCGDEKEDPVVTPAPNPPPAPSTPSTPGPAVVTGDALSSELLEELESQPAGNVDVGDILLPNGMTISEFNTELEGGRTEAEEDGPQRIKNKIIKGMLERAKFLTTRSNFQKPDEGPDRPAQNGLAYAIGNKDYTKREKPLASNGATTEYVYGLDCSGFISELAKDVIGKVADGVANQKNPDTWNTVLQQKFGQECNRVKMADKGHLPFSELMTGDIIYWLGDGNNHIGIIADTPGGERFMFNSNGSTGKGCAAKDDPAKCLKEEMEKNRGLKRGPWLIAMQTAVYTKGYWGNNYKVLRLVTEIEGKYEVAVRCTDEEDAAITATLTLTSKNEKDGMIPVTAEGDAKDYDGSPMHFTIKGEYNNTRNILKGSVYITFPDSPGEEREDGFEVELLKDDTGYFSATKIIVNDGCDVDFRLINKGCASSDNGRMRVVASGNAKGLRGR